MYDVAILGAGLVGLCVALRLSEAGQRVLIVDRGVAGGEASSAAAGMLAPSAEAQFGETPLAVLGVEAIKAYPAWIEALNKKAGVDIDYGRGPSLIAALDRDDAAQLRHQLLQQQRLGLPVRWATRDEVQALEPTLSPRVVGGLICDLDQWVDNFEVVQTLRQILLDAGVELREHTEASLWVEGLSDPVCRGLSLSTGEAVEARQTVLAAGAWSGHVWPVGWAGLKPPVRPVKGQILAVRAPPALALTHTVRSPRVYLVPRRNGDVIVGATSEERDFDRSITAGGMYQLLQMAVELWPSIQELPIIDTWTGLRPGVHDNLPLLGPCRVKGLCMATGHYRNGILLGPYTAGLVADWLVGGVLPEALGPFLPARLGL